MLFSDRSLWTMLHGIVLGGGALMALSATLFALYTARRAPRLPAEGNTLAWSTTLIAALLWLTVIVGTYLVFPPYRVTPPAGIADLTQYPRALILSRPDTAWLHAFAMESKEHMPWIASMLATAVAFVAIRHRATVLNDVSLRATAIRLLSICFVLVAFAALLGVFVNKVAPLW
jgi:hypothetical protein